VSLRVALVALALGAVACGGSTASEGSGGTGGSGGTATTGGSGGTGTGATSGSGGTGGTMCESFVPCCDASGNAVDPICPSGFPECPPGSDWPTTGTGQCVAQPGACSPTKPCAADEYCDYADDLCGNGAPGTCQKRPQGCPFLYAPVCACDGTIADNDCVAYSVKGVDLDSTGSCPAPSGTFACGTAYCTIGSEYCQRAVSDIGGWADSYVCKPLPSGCASCACLKNETCGQWCEADSTGNLTLTCPGG